MLKIGLSGCSGRMGQTVVNMVENLSDVTITAGFDVKKFKNHFFPIFESPFDCSGEVDVIIDFTHVSALENLLKYALSRKIPLVIATTGFSEELIMAINEASMVIPIFKSANMSIGINVLIDLVQRAAKSLPLDYNIEIIEKHHNQKLDAPSGTALLIADSITESLDYDPKYVFDRHSERKKRDFTEIGLHAVRGGTIVGEHEIIFAGDNEIISVSHSAQSRDIFANGALHAAAFIKGKPAGLYSMKDLIGG